MKDKERAFSEYEARLLKAIRHSTAPASAAESSTSPGLDESEFDLLARDLFELQFLHVPVYRDLCLSRGVTPESLGHWTGIPALPTAAFKEFEVTSLPPGQRTQVFHSSGTTLRQPSRHFHSPASLQVYEASLLPWFLRHLTPDLIDLKTRVAPLDLLILTPPPALTPHSSLVHMFERIRRHFESPETVFVGTVNPEGAWTLDFDRAASALDHAMNTGRAAMILGTAFLFLDLLDSLAERNRSFILPPGSRVLETGGYKGRTRQVPKGTLYAQITNRLGIPDSMIVAEYGMSELSSQAYDRAASPDAADTGRRLFLFPPWARAVIVSPETGRPATEGEPGLIRIIDLANIRSVLAIETEDLGVRHGPMFELIGRPVSAEPRGCSLMAR